MRLRVASAVALIAALGIGVSAQTQTGQTADGQPIYKPGSGVTFPTLIRQTQPLYTPNARQARITGAVELEAVVLPDGTVGEVRVIKSLDQVFGLDQQAVTAARTWLFRPGTREGKPVAVLVTLILEFRLGDVPPGAVAPKRTSGAQAPPEDEFTKGAYPVNTVGLVAPKIKRQLAPKYTSDGMRAKIQGVIEVEAVVMPDGTVGRARLVTSLDKVYGLDDEALYAAKKWTFEPGTLNGQPVPVLTKFVLEFRLH